MLLHIRYRAILEFGSFNRLRAVEWARVGRLVFVCAGNICRSPYGEAKATALGLNAASFGLLTTKYKSADPLAIENAARRGLSLAEHRTRDMSCLTFGPADLLIGMEPWHVQELKSLTDEFGVQVTLLGLWNNAIRPYLHDPYGNTDGYFQTCFEIEDRAIARMSRHLPR